MEALLKMTLIAAATGGFVFGLTPPTAQPNHDEKEKGKDAALSRRLVEQLSPMFPIVANAGVVSIMLVELVATWAARQGTELSEWRMLHILYPRGSKDVKIYMSSLFLLGAITTITGAYVRAACFRELGPMFTFKLSIRRQHKLVTSGPYSFVRHPSYISGILIGLGLTMCELSSGSWWMEAHIMDSFLGKSVAGLWGLGMVFGLVLVLLRVGKEDAMLKKDFGAEWEAYAAKVKFWFVPGIV